MELRLTIGGETVTVSPFFLADGSAPARQQTSARLQATQEALMVAFTVHDDDIWSTLTERDAPLWQEECVEVFIAPGPADSADYFEFEVNPLGALFEARIHNPTGLRQDMCTDMAWDCAGIEWSAAIEPAGRQWSAQLRLPWASLHQSPTLPREWRLALHRIERPRHGPPAEFSSWVPTLATPPNFHVPARFGRLTLLP